MAKLVLLHKANSIYEDVPDARYDFPHAYLKSVEEGVGDWVVYYEPVKAGLRGYFAAAKIARVIPKPGAEGRYLALIEQHSYLEFDQPVPRLANGRPWEAALRAPDGSPRAGGAQQLAVRRLPSSQRSCGWDCLTTWSGSRPGAMTRSRKGWKIRCCRSSAR